MSVCVVFDIDDTLYLERDYVRSGFEAAGVWAAQWIGCADFSERCWRRFVAGQRQSIFDEALRECGLAPAAELIQSLVAIYRTHKPSIALAPDADEALRTIREFAHIAVVSDGPATSQSRKAEALGLRSFADPVILTEILGNGFSKPHTRAFEQIQALRPADRFIYAGDNPAKDFQAPRKLGWITVRVRRPGGLHFAMDNVGATPDHEMSDCSALPELLASLLVST